MLTDKELRIQKLREEREVEAYQKICDEEKVKKNNYVSLLEDLLLKSDEVLLCYKYTNFSYESQYIRSYESNHSYVLKTCWKENPYEYGISRLNGDGAVFMKICEKINYPSEMIFVNNEGDFKKGNSGTRLNFDWFRDIIQQDRQMKHFSFKFNVVFPLIAEYLNFREIQSLLHCSKDTYQYLIGSYKKRIKEELYVIKFKEDPNYRICRFCGIFPLCKLFNFDIGCNDCAIRYYRPKLISFVTLEEVMKHIGIEYDHININENYKPTVEIIPDIHIKHLKNKIKDGSEYWEFAKKKFTN